MVTRARTGVSGRGPARVPPDINASITNEEQVIYVGKHGDDANDGLNIEEAKLTITNAMATAVAMLPTTTNRIVVRIHDGGTYTESFTVASWVQLHAPGATVVGTITLQDNADVFLHELQVATAAIGVSKTAGTGTSRFQADAVTCAGTGIGALNAGTSSVLIYEVKTTTVANGFGVGDISTAAGHVHVMCEDIYLSGTGTAVARLGAGTIEGYVAHILNTGAGTGTAINVAGGEMDLIVDRIATTAAYTVAVGATLNLTVLSLTGTRTNNGTVAELCLDDVGTGHTVLDVGTAYDINVAGVTVATFGATYLALGTNPAATGILRIPNAQQLFSRNAANTGDVAFGRVNAANEAVLGGAGATALRFEVAGNPEAYIGSTYLSLGTNPAASGIFRLPNNSWARWRNAANTNDVDGISITATNDVQIGGVAVNQIELHVGGGVGRVAEFGNMYLALGTNPAAAGIFRIPNNQEVQARNNANTANVTIAKVLTTDVLQLGGVGVAQIYMPSVAGSNIALHAQPANWQGMQGGIFMANAGAAPGGNPAGGGFLYAIAGAGTWRGSGGTVTAFGPAEPHCTLCHRDWVLYSYNPGVGNKTECTADHDPDDWAGALCVHCLVDELVRLGADPRRFMIKHRRFGRAEAQMAA